jgi:hypothetical protein
MRSTLVTLIAAAGCTGSSGIPGVRYANQRPIMRVNDRIDVPVRPEIRELSIDLYHFDGSFFRLITRAMELPRPRRALGVNALDEVPDSTWFTNRIGVREVSPDEVGRGAEVVGSPEPYKPWTIKSTKIGGQTVGFIIEDTRGKKFVLKFDRNRPESGPLPEIETAAEVITSKLLWACGYNVAEDHIVYLRRDDLVVAADAKIKDWSGTIGRLDDATVDRMLDEVVEGDDGRIRAMASLFIAGKPLGGHAAEGVRPDDPNDRIPHELRRDLRGAQAIFGWLEHTDVKEDNSLDVWTEDPANADHHYVKHYLLDFGGSLGFAAVAANNDRLGREYRLDFAAMFQSLATAGMRARSGGTRQLPGLVGVGLFDATFDPGAWRAETPAYVPFRTADRFDKFWAAKLVIRFTRDQLRAAVDAGRLSHPAAADYLVDTLVARQRTLARYWFWRVNPLDAFTVGDDGVCFDDLLLTHELGAVADRTRYHITTYDRAGARLGPERTVLATPGGRTCTAPLVLAPAPDAYTIVAIETTRLAFSGTSYVYVARDPDTGELRVIGIWRP